MLKIIFLSLMVTGMPVAIAMAGASLIYILVSRQHAADSWSIHRMIGGIDSFPLLAVPFFILAGNLMNNAGITNRIYNFALALVGWLKGGLGHVNVIGSVIFAGMSRHGDRRRRGPGHDRDQGDDATTATRKEFAVGVTAASATLGPIIPPSLPFVIYGDDGQRLDRPAVPRRHPARRRDGGADDADRRLLRAQEQLGRATSSSCGAASARRCSSWRIVIGFPLVIWAAGAGSASTRRGRRGRAGRAVRRRLELQVRGGAADHDAGAADRRHDHGHLHADRGRDRRLRLGAVPRPRSGTARSTGKMLVKVSMDTIETTATVLFIVAAASIFGWLLTATRVTDMVAAWVLGFTSEPWVFLLLANLLMLFVGCFLEPTAAITILVPVLMPVVPQLGIDPVHFGLVDGAQPDDRPAASADGHGAVRAGARGANVARAHDDGDPAVAGAAARQPDPDHLRAEHLAVAAAACSIARRAHERRSENASRSCRSTCRRRWCAPTRSSRSSRRRRRSCGSRCDDGAQGIGYTLHDRHRRLVGRSRCCATISRRG